MSAYLSSGSALPTDGLGQDDAAANEAREHFEFFVVISNGLFVEIRLFAGDIIPTLPQE